MRKQTEGYGNAQAHVEQKGIEKAEDEKALQVRECGLEPQPGRIYGSIDGAHDPLQQGWRELKTLCWYQVEKIRPSISRKHHGQSTGEQSDLQATAMKYHCDITEADQFGRLLWARFEFANSIKLCVLPTIVSGVRALFPERSRSALE